MIKKLQAEWEGFLIYVRVYQVFVLTLYIAAFAAVVQLS